MKKCLKKFISVVMISAFVLTTPLFAHAKTSDVQNIEQTLVKINQKYDLDVKLSKSITNDNKELVLNELERLENMLNMIENTKNNIEHTIEIDVNKNSKYNSMSLRSAPNTGYHKWEYKEIVDMEVGTTKYTKKANFNYDYENRDGYNRFLRVYNVTSKVINIEDLLITAGLRGWKQDGYSATFSDNDRAVTLKVEGHYQLGINWNFLSFGIKQPFSEETWTINLKFADNN